MLCQAKKRSLVTTVAAVCTTMALQEDIVAFRCDAFEPSDPQKAAIYAHDTVSYEATAVRKAKPPQDVDHPLPLLMNRISEVAQKPQCEAHLFLTWSNIAQRCLQW